MGGRVETVSSGNESTSNLLNIPSLITQYLIEVFGSHIAYGRCVVDPDPRIVSWDYSALYCA